MCACCLVAVSPIKFVIGYSKTNKCEDGSPSDNPIPIIRSSSTQLFSDSQFVLPAPWRPRQYALDVQYWKSAARGRPAAWPASVDSSGRLLAHPWASAVDLVYGAEGRMASHFSSCSHWRLERGTLRAHQSESRSPDLAPCSCLVFARAGGVPAGDASRVKRESRASYFQWVGNGLQCLLAILDGDHSRSRVRFVAHGYFAPKVIATALHRCSHTIRVVSLSFRSASEACARFLPWIAHRRGDPLRVHL